MEASDIMSLARTALEAFDVPPSQIEPLESVDHCNARVSAGAKTYFLKVLAPGLSTVRLRSRLLFADFLREKGLNVPRRLTAKSGNAFASVDTDLGERQVVVSEWIEGQTCGTSLERESVARLGELLGQLHVRSQEFEPPDDFTADSWDAVCMPAEDGWLSRLEATSRLVASARDAVHEAARRTRSIREQLPRELPVYGLIHADFHGNNVIDDGERLWIIDLDDVGWGYYLFDVTWPAVLAFKHQKGITTCFENLLHGYERARPLSLQERQLIPEFLLAGGLGALEMVFSSPVENDSPKAREWLTAILSWLQLHLEKT